ncbi:hypothetical protein WJX84_006389 [Apatococcus fuscideae]|uniref:6-phosphogluconolactonase n=1 Tax=Apatococcus fuscideae TaxID=2026836 RepID=A0AAW1SVM2_9CHLO
MFQPVLQGQPKVTPSAGRVAQNLSALRVRPDHPSRAHRPAASGQTVDATSSNGAVVAPAPTEPQELQDPSPAPGTRRASPRINVIKGTRWEKGIPPVMGAHLMASGSVAPISVSKGAGQGITPHMFLYPEKEITNTSILQYGNGDSGAAGLAEIVQSAAADAIEKKGSFTLVISGGSMIKALAQLAADSTASDFSKWHVAWADERNVALSNPDSNFKGADEAFLQKAGIPAQQTYALKEGLPVDETAKEYEGQLLRISQQVLPRNSAGFPVFDLVLLGIGPDGHVASLFPNRSQTAARKGWVLPVSDSPKPPSERITLTLPVINAAKEVGIVAFGDGKAEIVQRVLEVQALPGSLPAQLVRPDEGKLYWLLDAGSAGNLRSGKWEDAKAFPRST